VKTGRFRLALLASLVGLGVATSSGCSAVADEPESSAGPFNAIIADAEAAGVDAKQLDILREADRSGSVSFEQLKLAVEATFACFEDAGIAYASSVTEGAMPQLNYSFASPDGDSRIADACIGRHSMYVEMAYQTQPSALELIDAAFEKKRPEIVACLQGLGLSLADDASVDEIKAAASYTVEEWESIWKDAPRSPDDCVTNAGIMNW